MRRAAGEAMAKGAPRLIRIKPKDDVVESVDADGIELHRSSCPSGGTVELFLEPMRQDMRLVVCGASPVAALLQQLGAEIPPARKSVLHGPAGLDIGAIDPEEIALSILAEIVQERRRSVRAEAQDSVTG